MAQAIANINYPWAEIGKVLAEHTSSQLMPGAAGVNWSMRIHGDGVVMAFDTEATENAVVPMRSKLDEMVVMHAIEQSAALEKQAIDKAYGLGQQLIDKLKEELTVA